MMKKKSMAAKFEKNWTVLLVDGQGRIRRIRKFRQKLWMIGALCAGSLIFGAVMLALYGGAVRNQIVLSEETSTLREEITALQQQNELLKVRAVRMEALVAKSGHQATTAPAATVSKPSPASPEPPAVKPVEEKVVPPVSQPAATAKKAAQTEPAQAAEPEEKIDPQVDAERLKVAYQPDTEMIEAQFVIKNTGQGPAGGRAVVVLHTTDEGSPLQFALPSVPLREGRPIGNRGRRFSISRFMTLKLDRKFAEPGTRFAQAKVFAFSLEGKLLLEKSFDVALEIPEEKAPPSATIIPSMQLDDTAPTAAPLGLSLPEPKPEETTGAQP